MNNYYMKKRNILLSSATILFVFVNSVIKEI